MCLEMLFYPPLPSCCRRFVYPLITPFESTSPEIAWSLWICGREIVLHNFELEVFPGEEFGAGRMIQVWSEAIIWGIGEELEVFSVAEGGYW